MGAPEVMIEARNLGKSYRIGRKEERRDTLRDVIVDLAKAPWRRLVKGGGAGPEIIWALDDVSFEVKSGEVLGIIGRNGAGKSTLLKILSRITAPTRGRVELRGRVGSLLEVGTGFHPELTGRENIYLNGAILGMSRKEIKARFDEIVDFAGIEKFMDTPVKRYSSGMYVRLAFAVAAHLEPEILLVDEVLAVGDAAFQKKCLGKMGSVIQEGRTVLFVSHNMAAVETLCQRVMLLDQGSVRSVGEARTVIGDYLAAANRPTAGNDGEWDLSGLPRAPGHRPILRHLTMSDQAGRTTSVLRCGDDLTLRMDYDNQGMKLKGPRFIIRVMDSLGRPLFLLQNNFQQESPVETAGPLGSVTCRIKRLPLIPGRYKISLAASTPHLFLDLLNEAIDFTVEYGDFFGTGRMPNAAQGPFLLDCRWTYSERAEPTSAEGDG
jgi:lipopolysaccharide transport system ATP-binding protein